MRKISLIGLLLLSGLAGACAQSDNSPAAPTPTPTITPLPPVAVVSPARTIISTSTVENKDGSTTVIATYSDGTKSEVRTFKSGQLTRVARETNAAGLRTARVTYRADGREVEVREPSWVDKAMDATGDALVTAANKTKQGAIEVADKAEDVGDATKKGVKKGVREVGDKAEDVGDAVKKGTKKVTKQVTDTVK